LGPLDMLLAFEDYSRAQERMYQEESQKKTIEKARKDRKAREAFRVSLSTLSEKQCVTHEYHRNCWVNSSRLDIFVPK
jgi:hypothetical protein